MTANTEQLQILEKLCERNCFLQNTSRWLFLSFKWFTKVLRVLQYYFDILLHSKCQALRAASSHAEKDSPRKFYLYLTAKNSACVLKLKQTWPEQAVYRLYSYKIDLTKSKTQANHSFKQPLKLLLENTSSKNRYS